MQKNNWGGGWKGEVRRGGPCACEIKFIKLIPFDIRTLNNSMTSRKMLRIIIVYLSNMHGIDGLEKILAVFFSWINYNRRITFTFRREIHQSSLRIIFDIIRIRGKKKKKRIRSLLDVSFAADNWRKLEKFRNFRSFSILYLSIHATYTNVYVTSRMSHVLLSLMQTLEQFARGTISGKQPETAHWII